MISLDDLLKYIEDLEKMVEVLSNELEGYIDAEYKDLLNYPLNVRRKERDMQIVNEARKLLKKGKNDNTRRTTSTTDGRS